MTASDRATPGHQPPGPPPPDGPSPDLPWTEVFRTLEDHCRRAPSNRNTQPWRLHYEPDRISIHWVPERTLPHTDPHQRDLFLSLGAFLETCLIVAADAGLAVRPSIHVDQADCRAARLLPADTPYPTPFTTSTVEARRTSRGPHRPGPLTGSELGAARDQLTPLPFARLIHLHTRELAVLNSRADRACYRDPSAVAELRQWLRLTPRHPRYTLDGITERALGLARWRAVVLTVCFAASIHPIMRHLGLSRLLAAAHHSLLRYDGSVLVLVGDTNTGRGPAADTPEGLIEHGRALVRAWYALTERGVCVHPLGGIVDGPTTGPLLAARLGVGRERRILSAFRAGHPWEQPVRSFRIPTPRH
jgi:hypothetical protein